LPSLLTPCGLTASIDTTAGPSLRATASKRSLSAPSSARFPAGRTPGESACAIGSQCGSETAAAPPSAALLPRKARVQKRRRSDAPEFGEFASGLIAESALAARQF